MWYYNLSRVIREADIRATIHLNNPDLKDQPFLKEYLEFRETDGSYKAILELKYKNSTSPLNSNTNKHSSSVLPAGSTLEKTDEEEGLDKFKQLTSPNNAFGEILDERG